jgi:hypothetical protein
VDGEDVVDDGGPVPHLGWVRGRLKRRRGALLAHSHGELGGGRQRGDRRGSGGGEK